VASVACTWNTSPSVFIINFTAQIFDQAGISNYTWFANDSSGFGNATQTIQYTLNKAMPTLVLSNNTASVNTSGLVGYWRFEEGSGTTASDSSGNGNSGTLYNSPIWTNGYFGNALGFDGVDDYVNLPSTVQLTNQSFTIMSWMKPSSLTGNYQMFGPTQWNAVGIGLVAGSNQIFCQFNTGGLNIQSSAIVPNTNQWYHVVCSFDWSTSLLSIYVNGTRINSWTATNPSFNWNNFYIGSQGPDGNLFNGTIDEVQVWNRALTASEIYEMYQSKVTYPASTTFTGSNCPTGLGAADVTCNLYRNLTSASNPDTQTLAAGFYYYIYNTSGGANYTLTNILLPLNVSQPTTPPSPMSLTIFLNSSKVWWNDSIYASGSAVYANGTMDSSDTYTFYINEISQCGGTTNSSGGWSCTFRAPIEINSYEAKISLVAAAASNTTVLYVRPNYGFTPSGTSNRAVIEIPSFIEDMNGRLKIVIVRITAST